MDIYKVFEEPRIKMLENDIVLWNNHCRYTDEEWHVMKQLLRSRSNVLYELNVYDSDMHQMLVSFHQMLVSFNNRLRKALRPLYDDGCAWTLRCSKAYYPEHGGCESFEKWIGIEDENDNWNEGLNREWSGDIHLIQLFHNLYDHCHFSLYDLIYVYDFDLEVHIQLDRNVKYE